MKAFNLKILTTLAQLQIWTLSFPTLSLSGTSCISCIILSNASTVCNDIGYMSLFMGLVNQVGHWSLCIDGNILPSMTTSLCSWSYDSPENYALFVPILLNICPTLCFHLDESNVFSSSESSVKSFLTTSLPATSYHFSNPGPSA